MRYQRTLLCAALVLSQACAAQPVDPDGEAVGPEDIGGTGTAVRIASGETDHYYAIRPDYRRCAYPFCGGYWVRSVNESPTECGDGTVADECYVTDLDLIVLGLSEREEAELRGDVDGLILRGGWGLTEVEGRTLMFFEVEEAWRPLTDAAPTGWFFKAMDNGVRCVTTPCDTLEAAYLDYPWWFGVDRLSLRRVGLSDAQIADVSAAIADGGILLAGRSWATYRRYDIRLWIQASQVYLPIEPAELPAPIGACAAMLCPVGTRCIEEGREGYCVSDGSLECGATTCAEGLVCCNPSCGICTPPGSACIQIACLPEE